MRKEGREGERTVSEQEEEREDTFTCFRDLKKSACTDKDREGWEIGTVRVAVCIHLFGKSRI